MGHSKSEDDLFFWLCAGIVLGVLGFFRGFKLRTKKKLIENIPTSTVRGMAMGLVEVKGAAQPFQGLMKTPFSKVDAVYYHYKVEEHQSSGKSSHWVTIAEFSTADIFYLEDETGKVMVFPERAELFLNVDRSFNMNTFGNKADQEAFKQGLIDLGIKPQGFMGMDRSLRCKEQYICPGDEIYIMGTAAKNPMVAGSAVGSENLCIMKENSFFCISDKSEKGLLDSLTGQMYLFLYGGPVLTVICLLYLIKTYFPNIF